MSALTVISCLVYLVVAAVFALAAVRTSTGPGNAATQYVWRFGVAFFVFMSCVRILGIEELARRTLRGALRKSEIYEERIGMQGPVVAAIILLIPAAIMTVWWLRSNGSFRQLSPMAFWAAIAIAGFVPLFAVRLASLHSLDALLYSGSLHLNWVVDSGLTFLAGACAGWGTRKRKGPTTRRETMSCGRR